MSVTDLSPVPLAAGASPHEVVDRITGAAKSSFSLGMKLLSRPRRAAMRAIYAFCRVVDDIADGDLPAETKKAMLADWRAEIERLFDGNPQSAIGQALLDPVAAYGLPKAEFLGMIDGMETDADGPVVAPSMDELRLYTRRVAGTVGMLSMRVFGAYQGEPSERFALALADALQLTNILRDVEEDAGIGRLYLPREILAEAGATRDPSGIPDDPNLAAVCADLGATARAEFDTARSLIPLHSRSSIAPALAMLGVYEGYLDRMEASGWARPAASMGKFEKIRRGLLAAMFAGPRD